MRIGFLTPEYGSFGSDRGGLGYYLSRTTPLLAARGHDCEVFLCAGRESVEPEAEQDHGGVTVRRLTTRNTPFDGLDLPGQVRRHLRSAWTLADALAIRHAEAPFDVLQVPNFGVSGLFVDVPVPTVMRFSSHAPTWHRAAAVPRTLRVVFGELLQRRAIRRADRHFAPSRFVADLVAAETGLDVRVVRPPLLKPDRGRWEVEWATSVAGDAPYVVHAGQLGPAKGTDLVVKAAEVFLRQRTDLHLHCCGRDAGAVASIEALADRIPGRVHYHGVVSPARLFALMDGCRAVLAPSRADNLPNVVIEAMSIGCPVVGVRDASIDELVVSGESGYLAPRHDGQALASAVLELVRLDEDERISMGRHARERVGAMLDQSAAIDALVEAYSDAARSPRRRRRPRYREARAVRLQLRSRDLSVRVKNAPTALKRLAFQTRVRAAGRCLAGRFRAEDALVITSSPRSGSTWLGQVLTAIPGSYHLFEPLQLDRVPEAAAAGFAWRTYVPPEGEWPAGEAFLRRVFEGRVVNGWTAGESSWLRACRASELIVKFVRANRLLPWLCSAFPMRPPILLVRHPCAVIASQLRSTDWSQERPDEPTFIEALPAFRDVLAECTSPEEFLAASWALDQIAALMRPAPHPWLLVTYESLVLDPESVLDRIGEAWTVDIDRKAARRLLEKRSSVVYKSGMSGIAGWRDQLDDGQVGRILDTVERFGLPFYTSALEADPSLMDADRVSRTIRDTGGMREP